MASLDDKVARFVHDVWREVMAAKGWRYGPVFDAAARTHDALVPYDQLSSVDRWRVLIAVRAERAVETIAALACYERDPYRPLSLEDMRVGLPVEVKPDAWGETCDLVGRVESWETDQTGQYLENIRVLWSDGTRGEYCPIGCEIQKAEEQ